MDICDFTHTLCDKLQILIKYSILSVSVYGF